MTDLAADPTRTEALEGNPASLDLGWITLGYHDIGPIRGVADGPPIVLLHGAGPGATALSNFVANVPVLAERHRVLAVDLPGFGRSDPYVMTNESRQTVNARAIAGLLEGLGVDRADFVGNSLGGGAALAVAIDFPERVNRLVLMGCRGRTTLFAPSPTEGIKALEHTYRDPSLSSFRAFYDVMLYDGASVADEALAKRARGVRQEYVDAWIASYASPTRHMGAELRQVQARTLILHGRDDRVVPFESAISLLAELANSELHAFNRCGHWIQYEHAEVFNAMVLEFFARL